MEEDIKYHPAGNLSWEWEWMGFSVPNFESNLKFEKFRNCFGSYFGIGDFDFWEKRRLLQLTEEEKVELVQLLLEDYNKNLNPDTSESKRKYLGLIDGKINPNIDEFANGRKHFWSKLTIDECRNNVWPHNQRTRYESGFFCDDCGIFFPLISKDYILDEYATNCGLTIHNICVDFVRDDKPIPQDILDVQMEYENIQNKHVYDRTETEIYDLSKKVKNLLKKYGNN